VIEGLFVGFAAAAVVSGLLVILHRNPVTSALFLVLALCSLAGIYLTLHAEFLGFVQVIVYAGAIMVLFLFVIMLLNLQHVAEPVTRPVQQFLGYTSGAAFGLGLVYYIVKYAAFAKLPNGPFQTDAHTIGVKLFEAYVFPFEMVSILLLAAIVGALLLSGRQYQKREAAR
jgi:NADH-quinone oxidoreductase subunit J